MSKNLRARYYDLFSHFYDGFVALHSSDRRGKLRDYLADQAGLSRGDAVLDICTGTGAMLPCLHVCVGTEGMVVGVDFSRGMLRKAKSKFGTHGNVHLLQADAGHLPFKESVFDGVTCSHAFYELKGETSRQCLEAVVRILKKGKCFLMMEHDIPKRLPVRMLFYMRMFSMGLKKALEILKNEEALFRDHFGSVKTVRLETGKSKILIGENQ